MKICQLLRICDFDILFHCHFGKNLKNTLKKVPYIKNNVYFCTEIMSKNQKSAL